MKKSIIVIVIVTLLIFASTIIFVNIHSLNVSKKKISEDKKDTSVVVPEEEEEVIKYIDENKTPISIYKQSTGLLTKVSETKEKYVSKKDIFVYQIYPSVDESVSYSGRFGKKCGDKWLEIDSEHKIKQGFIISYGLKDGTKITQKITGPDTTQTNYDYIEIYLYDDYAHRNDSWYSHIESKDFKDSTYFTSIKITAGSKISEVVTPISLKTYTYDTEDDFDENGIYRGNSFAEVTICDLNSTCN